MAVMTDAQREESKRLEGVLMPYFRRQRMRMFPDGERPKRFVHYTSAEAAFKIIKTKRLWMRNTTCMVDFNEVRHGHNILLRFFAKQENRDFFIQSLEPCAPGIAQEVLTLVDHWSPDIHLNTYITCFSEHRDEEDLHGRLSMWRAFGSGQTTRVGFVINIPGESSGAAALNIIFSPVAYLGEQEIHAQLLQIIKNIHAEQAFLTSIPRESLSSWLFRMIAMAMICSKHPGFHEEREWRAVYSPNQAKSQLMEASTETVAGVPQIVHKIPIDQSTSDLLTDIDFVRMFDRIIIGPTPYPWAVAGAFIEALSSAGVADANTRVHASTIPLRQ